MGNYCCNAQKKPENRKNAQNNVNLLLIANVQNKILGQPNKNISKENTEIIEQQNPTNQNSPQTKKMQGSSTITELTFNQQKEEQKEANEKKLISMKQYTQETNSQTNSKKNITSQEEEFKQKLQQSGIGSFKLKETKTINNTELVHKYCEIQLKEIKSQESQVTLNKSFKCIQPGSSMVSRCGSQKNCSIAQIEHGHKKSSITTLNFIGNESQIGSNKSDNNKLISFISSGEGAIPIFQDLKLTADRLKEFQKQMIVNSLSLNEIISYSENKPKLGAENNSSDFKLVSINDKCTSDLAEQFMRERIKFKSSHQILESSVLDEMYKLKLYAFFMKRNCINKIQLQPWNEQFEKCQLCENFVDKEFQITTIENQQYLINFQQLAPLQEQSTSVEQIPLKQFIAGINTSDQIFACLQTLISHHNQHTKILNYLIYPQNNTTRQPILTSNQRFFIKMYINGTCRAVQLDSLGMKGYVEGCLLGRILEKALLKIEGDMIIAANSSSAILNHRICGWVPEEIQFSEIPNKANLWSRLFANFLEGNILLVLGGNQIEANKDGSVVAVLDMKEAGDNSEKKLVLINGVFLKIFYNLIENNIKAQVLKQRLSWRMVELGPNC